MSIRTLFCAIVVLTLLVAAPLGAATITIVNNDSAGEGFNDLTVVAPVGGNAGETLGAQRLIVFQAAADMWGALLESDVEIRVGANFDPLTCTATSGILGSAGSNFIYRNFPNIPLANTWYHSALADALAGADQSPAVVDINATFNSNLDDDPACLGGIGWYYGLDGNPGDAEDLYPTITHEIAHGLGFSGFMNVSNGALMQGFPDVFSTYSFDTSEGLSFTDLADNAARVAAVIDYFDIVWNGASVAADSANHLDRTLAALRINSPGAIAGDYDSFSTSTIFSAPENRWGGVLDTTGVTAEIELTNDGDDTSGCDPGTSTLSDGCQPLVGFTPGNIALIDRGCCEFGVKAQMAEDAGAAAVVVADNISQALVLMGAGDFGSGVTIPAASVHLATGNVIKSQLPGVNATLGIFRLTHADTAGRPYLYTPDPVEPGSSHSHWDTTMTPSELMEPAAFVGDDGSPGMAAALMEDIGWTLIPAELIFSDGFETGDTIMW